MPRLIHCGGIHGEVNHPMMLNSTERDGDMDSVDANREILQINPQYNLGELLQWLRLRSDTIERLQDSRLYELTQKLNIVSMELTEYDLTIHMREDPNPRSVELEQYLRYLGLADITTSSILVSVDISEGDYEICKSIVDEFIAIRLITVRHHPSINITQGM